jgi:hypothetical protein
MSSADVIIEQMFPGTDNKPWQTWRESEMPVDIPDKYSKGSLERPGEWSSMVFLKDNDLFCAEPEYSCRNPA